MMNSGERDLSKVVFFFPSADNASRSVWKTGKTRIVRENNRRKLSCALASRESTEIERLYARSIRVILIRLFPTDSVFLRRALCRFRMNSHVHASTCCRSFLWSIDRTYTRREHIYRMHLDRDGHNISISEVSLSFFSSPFLFYMYTYMHLIHGAAINLDRSKLTARMSTLRRVSICP